MGNWIKKATLGVALGAAALTAAAPADAQRYYNHGYRGHDRTGPAVVAGIAGLAIGAAIASNNRGRYYDRGYDGYYDRGYSYDRGYYDRGYPSRGYYNGGYYDRGYYDRGYRTCVVRRVYDPYIGRSVRIRSC